MSGWNVQRKLGTTRGSPRRSCTAKALRISRHAVKSRCACEWDGWGRLSDDGPGQNNPVPSEGLWGGELVAHHGGALSSPRPDTVRDYRSDHEVHEGRRQTGCRPAHAGSRLKLIDAPGRSRLIRQPSSRTGENSPYGMIGGIEETSASFEARYAPRSYPTTADIRLGNGRVDELARKLQAKRLQHLYQWGRMELPGTSYLYNLTLISVTFAGFAALIAAFRQMVGGRFTKYDAFLIRSALVRSLIVIVCALLPPLLALFELPTSTIWRVSSLTAAVLVALFTLFWPLIVRRLSTERPLSKMAKAYHGLQLLVAIFLLMVSLGILFEPTPGYFAVGLQFS